MNSIPYEERFFGWLASPILASYFHCCLINGEVYVCGIYDKLIKDNLNVVMRVSRSYYWVSSCGPSIWCFYFLMFSLELGPS